MSMITKALLIAVFVALSTACVTTGQKPGPTEESRNEAAVLNTSLGVTYMRKGQLDVAMEKLQRAITLNPDLAEAHNALAYLYTQLGEPSKARHEYQTSLRLDPKSSPTMNNYGTFLCAQGEYDEAMKYFAKAVENALYQTPEAAYGNAGICALENGHRVEADEYFRLALMAEPQFGTALLQMAQLSYDDEIYLQARAFIDRFMQSSLNPPPNALWLGLQIEQAMDNNAAANRYADRLIENFPDSVQTRWVLEMERNAG